MQTRSSSIIHNVGIGDGKTSVRTVVTNSGTKVEEWIGEVEKKHSERLGSLVVGLDVEWRPSFKKGVEYPVAILQLCVGRRCLIFQLLHADCIPDSLYHFLAHPDYRFVGVGVAADASKLMAHYDLRVANTLDLRDEAALKRGDWSLKNTGLKGLARLVLDLEMEKPKRVTLSRWDHLYLDYSQVRYACLDAYASFEIGRTLIAAPQPAHPPLPQLALEWM